MRISFLSLLSVSVAVTVVGAPDNDPSKLSDEELVGQLVQTSLQHILTEDSTGVDDSKLLEYRKVGSFFDQPSSSSIVPLDTFKGWPSLKKERLLGKFGLPDTELSSLILPTFGLDSVHGANYIPGATIYPHNLALASTWNPENARNEGWSAAAFTKNGTDSVVGWVFSPAIELGTNPSWGRTYESFGESVEVASKFGAAVLEGMETVPGVVGTLKHFLAYSNNAGRDRSYGKSNIATDREWRLWNSTLPLASSVMSSYTSADGLTSVNFGDTLKTLRRGWDGLLVTDFDEVFNAVTWHHNIATLYDSVVHFLNSEVEVLMVPSDALKVIELGTKAMADGRVERDKLVEKVRRVWKFKTLMTNDAPIEVDVEADRQNAASAAKESVILLKNENDVLPIKKNAKVFLTGPYAKSLSALSGGWTFHWQGANEADEGFDLLCKEGGFCMTIADALLEHGTFDLTVDTSQNQADAVSAAMNSSPEVVIVVVGEVSYAEKPGDVRSLQLSQDQIDLVEELRVTLDEKIKIVVVYVGGRPRLLGSVVKNSDAILASFLPGPSGGHAIAHVIDGALNPSGKLPLTWPKFQDGGGTPYDTSITDLCTKQQAEYNGLEISGKEGLPSYEYVECDVEWRFGFGLSYTSFSEEFVTEKEGGTNVGDLKISPNSKEIGNHLHFDVKVTNTGNVAGAYTSMLFYETLFRSSVPSKEELFSFFKTAMLQPGESTIVKHRLYADQLKFFSPDSAHGSHFVFEDGMVPTMVLIRMCARSQHLEEFCARLPPL